MMKGTFFMIPERAQVRRNPCRKGEVWNETHRFSVGEHYISWMNSILILRRPTFLSDLGVSSSSSLSLPLSTASWSLMKVSSVPQLGRQAGHGGLGSLAGQLCLGACRGCVGACAW